CRCGDLAPPPCRVCRACKKPIGAAAERCTACSTTQLHAIPFLLAHALWSRGQELLREGRRPQALACFGSLLEAEPSRGDVWIRAAEVLISLRRHQDAAGCLARAIDLGWM